MNLEGITVKPHIRVRPPDMLWVLSGNITPAQMQTAYGLNLLTETGAGQTIAIIDAFHNPNCVSDANLFSIAFGLPQFNQGGGSPTLTLLDENGGTNLPSTLADSQGSWGLEASLDVQWAHAIAPHANIILFECNSSGPLDLYTGAGTAAGTTGVSVVSMSWGGAEFSYEAIYDPIYFSTPVGHPGVTFCASTGDTGDNADEYPAFSPNVVAVGGTVLTVSNAGAWLSETGWSGSGGDVSLYESIPNYQLGKVNNNSSALRCNPDVSINGGTDVTIYNNGSTFSVAGTSLSCPMWAGIIALINQGLANSGVGSLDGPSQTLPALYSINYASYHDIISGNNGHPAGTGYDLVTGLGSPIANVLIPNMINFFASSSPSHPPGNKLLTNSHRMVIPLAQAGQSSRAYYAF